MKNKLINPFDLPGNWYKANLHTHSTTSDGAVSPEQVVRMYRARGYRVLALTDHDNHNKVAPLTDRKLLVINGLELWAPKRKGSEALDGFHICAIGVPTGFKLARPFKTGAQRCIDLITKAGGASILAHAKECGLSPYDTSRLNGFSGMEVWTTMSEVDGDKGSSEDEWTEALEHGRFWSATAADDTHWNPAHGWADAFGGWTMLKMPRLTQKAVIDAIRNGATYSSTGPVIHDFRAVGGKVRLKCSPAAKIRFRAPGNFSRYRWAERGKALRGFTMPVPDNTPWIRAIVTDHVGKRAWTNPIML